MSTATAEVKPKRIQRKRTKGSKLPDGTLCVTRPGRHGNCFPVGMWFHKFTADWNVWSCGDSPHFGNEQVRDLPHSLELFRDYAKHRAQRDPLWLEPVRRAKFVACWCKENAICHADILIELAFQ